MKKLVALLLALAMVAMLAACGTTDGGSANSGSTDGGSTEATDQTDAGTTDEGGDAAADTATTGGEKVLRGTCTTTPETCDAAKGTGSNDQVLYVNTYESLVEQDATDGHAVGLLADSWEAEEDGLTYTFHLKDNVVFASGNPFTANDVKYSMERLLAIGEGFASTFAQYVDAVNVIDDYTVEFKLKEAFGPFVSALLTFKIVDSELLKANQEDGDYGENGDYGTGYMMTHTAGSGPYYVESFNVHDKYVLAKNTNYWNGVSADAPDKVEIQELIEAATTKMLITSGDIDYIHGEVDSETFSAITAQDNLDYVILEQSGLNFFQMNTKKAPTDDVHIRKAISYATDKEQMSELIGQGVSPAKGPVPAVVYGYTEDYEGFDYDMEKAKEEIAQSQYADNLKDYQLSIDYIEGNGNTGKVAYTLASSLESLGFNVVINETPWVNFCNNEAEIDTSPNITNLFVTADYPEAASILELKYASWTLGNWNQNEWLQDDKFDQMINDAKSTVDDDERVAKYAEIQKYIVDEVVPSIYTCTYVICPVFNTDVVEWCPKHFFYFDNWRFAEMKMK